MVYGIQSLVNSLGFRFRICGLGFLVKSVGFRAQDVWFMIYGLRFGVRV